MCTLPHCRYDKVKQHCGQLRKYGLIEKSGSTATSTNFRTTERFNEWKRAFESGETRLQPLNYFKEKKQNHETPANH